MSQITAYIGGGGPGPTGGIETVTGNDGGAIAGDGGTPNNINIIGAGIITTTGDPLTNTVTITSTGAAAIFPTDDGSALPSILGDLSIRGGTNINTDALIANTVTIALTPDVALTGFLHAGAEVTAGTYITAATYITAGTTIAATNNITSGAILQGANLTITSFGAGALVVNDAATHVVSSVNGAAGAVLMANEIGGPTFQTLPGTAINFLANIGAGTTPQAGNITFDGIANQIATVSPAVITGAGHVSIGLPLVITAPGSLTTTGALTSNTTLTTNGINTLNNLAVNGVVQTNAAHQLIASNGANGTVLIGTGVGNAPVWNTITAGTNVTVTNTAGHISIASTAGSGSAVSSFFARQSIDTGYITGDNSGNWAYLGSNAVMSLAGADCFNTGTDFAVGNGAGTAASYTAPFSGVTNKRAIGYLETAIPKTTG